MKSKIKKESYTPHPSIRIPPEKDFQTKSFGIEFNSNAELEAMCSEDPERFLLGGVHLRSDMKGRKGRICAVSTDGAGLVVVPVNILREEGDTTSFTWDYIIPREVFALAKKAQGDRHSAIIYVNGVTLRVIYKGEPKTFKAFKKEPFEPRLNMNAVIPDLPVKPTFSIALDAERLFKMAKALNSKSKKDKRKGEGYDVTLVFTDEFSPIIVNQHREHAGYGVLMPVRMG